MLAGPLFGLAQHFGYRLAFVLAAGPCLAGLLLLTLVGPHRSGQRGLPESSQFMRMVRKRRSTTPGGRPAGVAS